MNKPRMAWDTNPASEPMSNASLPRYVLLPLSLFSLYSTNIFNPKHITNTHHISRSISTMYPKSNANP